MRLTQFIKKPTIITEPGQYKTRCGDEVTITEINKHHAHGHYFDGVPELWDICGRLLPFTESQNDIIKHGVPKKDHDIVASV